MPSFSDIETSYVQRYAQDVQHALQQKTTRLRNAVSQKLDCSGIAEFIDRIGNASAENKNARFADSPVQSIAHQRRRVTARPYHAGFFVEGFDTRRMNYDVFQPYAEATSMAMARKMDETGLGNHPELVKAFAKIGATMGEDRLIVGSGLGQSRISPHDAKDQIQSLYQDKDFSKAYRDNKEPGHKAAMDKMDKLFRTAYPGP